jgi:hypothetical protein
MSATGWCDARSSIGATPTVRTPAVHNSERPPSGPAAPDHSAVHAGHGDGGPSPLLPAAVELEQSSAEYQGGLSVVARPAALMNPQVGGFITLVMSPLITSPRSSSSRPTQRAEMAPKTSSPQVGGFITSRRGVHHARTGSISGANELTDRTTTLHTVGAPAPLPRRTPAAPTAAERRPECRFAPRAARPRLSVGCLEGHTPSSLRHDDLEGFSAPIAHQCHDRVVTTAPARKAGRVGEPAGITVESPSAPILQAHKAEEAGSKIGDQYY